MYFFRADGNEKIGAGHIMRCLTVADALAEIVPKKEIMFLCSDSSSAGLSLSKGFQATVLNTDFKDMETEISVLKNLPLIMGTSSNNIFIVDSYFVTNTYLTSLSKFGKVILFDDLGERKYPVQGIINYNISASIGDYEKLYSNSGTKLFIGPEFIPVRKEFTDHTFKLNKKVSKILITAGGGDTDNITGQVLDAIYSPDLCFNLIVGQFNPHLQALKEKETLGNVHIYSSVSNMAELICENDLVITAGGSTVYELAALKAPFICFSYAKNQEPLTEFIGSNKLSFYAGAYDKDSVGMLLKLKSAFDILLNDYPLRESISKGLSNLTDGLGAKRLANSIFKFIQEES